MADMPAFQAGLIGDGSHDVARLHAVHMTHFDAERLECNPLRTAPLARRLVWARLRIRMLSHLKLRRLRRRRISIGSVTPTTLSGRLRFNPLPPSVIPRLEFLGPSLAPRQPLRFILRRPRASAAPLSTLGEPRFPLSALVPLRLLRQQQRRATLKQAGKRGRDINCGHVLLPLKLFEELPEQCALTCRHCLRDALFELRHALLIDVSDRRQAHLIDPLARGALDDPQHVAFARRDEKDRLTTAPRTTGAPDA